MRTKNGEKIIRFPLLVGGLRLEINCWVGTFQKEGCPPDRLSSIVFFNLEFTLSVLLQLHPLSSSPMNQQIGKHKNGQKY